MPKINQQLIADQLNVSRATVSRCFTNHSAINPETRSKVFQLAAQLGYKHMEMRSRPQSSRNNRIGVLICSDIEEFQREDYESPGTDLLAGVSEYGLLSHSRIELHYVDPKARSLADPSYAGIEALTKRQWQGAILVYPFPRSIVETLVARFPVVSLVEQYSRTAMNCVDVDHYRGIATLMNHLTACGHERIGFFTKPYEVEAGWSYRRFSAYVEKLARRGEAVDERNVVNVLPNDRTTLDESYLHVAERIRDGVTGWLCAADHQAYDLIAGLRKLGIRTPRDVSVTGFDGIHPPKGAPVLTTMEIPYREIGLSGARRLRELIKKRFDTPQHILVSSTFREGETVKRKR